MKNNLHIFTLVGILCRELQQIFGTIQTLFLFTFYDIAFGFIIRIDLCVLLNVLYFRFYFFLIVVLW